MSSQNKTGENVKYLPSNVSNALPIFQILGNQLPQSLQTPEAKRTFGRIAFGGLVIGAAYLFFKALPTLIAGTSLLITFGILLAILALIVKLGPSFVTLLTDAGRVVIEKLNRRLKESNSVEWLRISLQQVQDVFQEVRGKVTQVEAVAVNMKDEAEVQDQKAGEKLRELKKLSADAKDLDEKAAKAKSEDEARKYKRQANESRAGATIAKSEYEAAVELTKTYAQYGNEFNKVLDVLKDNESAARIHISLLKSSIDIIEDKLRATDRMRKATQGLADIFNITNETDFELALSATRFKISENVANIRRNLEFVNQSRLTSVSTMQSQTELDSFITSIDTNKMQKLNVDAIIDSSHQMQFSEMPKNKINILDSI